MEIAWISALTGLDVIWCPKLSDLAIILECPRSRTFHCNSNVNMTKTFVPAWASRKLRSYVIYKVSQFKSMSLRFAQRPHSGGHFKLLFRSKETRNQNKINRFDQHISFEFLIQSLDQIIWGCWNFRANGQCHSNLIVHWLAPLSFN